MTIPAWKCLLGACLAFALLLVSLPAVAQETPIPSAPTVAKGDNPQERFLKGNVEFKAKRFSKALEAYLDALAEVEDSQHPEVLFNIAMTYRALHRPKEAAYYEQRYQILTQPAVPAPIKPPSPTIAAPAAPAATAGNPQAQPIGGGTPAVAPAQAKPNAQAPANVQMDKAIKVVADRSWWSPSPLGMLSNVFKYALYILAAGLLVLSIFAFIEGELGPGLVLVVISVGAAYLGRIL